MHSRKGARSQNHPVHALSARSSARQWSRLAVFLVLSAALAHNIAGTWQMWGDVIVDTGRELDVPRQLLAGKLLYRDVRYWYGPAAPYANAMLYAVFGVHTDVLTSAGLATAAAIAWLSYRTARLLAGRLVAAAAAVAVLYVNAFAQLYVVSIFNFVLPYAFAATYGMLAALASAFFLLRHVLRGRRRDFFLSCALLAVTALCKLEVLFAAGVMHMLFVLAWVTLCRRGARCHLWGYAAAVAVPAVVYGFFRAQVGESLWSDNLFVPGNVTAGGFALVHSGLADYGQSLRQAGLSAVGLGACLGIAWLLARLEMRNSNRTPHGTGNIQVPQGSRATAVIMGLAGGLLSGAICVWLGPFLVFRALPVVLFFGLVLAASRMIARRGEAGPQVAFMLLAAFALASAARIVLRCGAEHYGFYLMLPGLLALAVIWSRIRPNPAGTRAAVSSRVCVGLALCALALSHAWNTSRTVESVFGRGEPRRVHTAAGTLPCRNIYVGSVDKAVRFLTGMPADTKVVVMPEGAGMTFLAGLTNPLGMHTFLPLDFSGAYDEPAVIRRLAAADPDYIVFNSRGVGEYGKRGLGLDYGLDVVRWVEDRYAVVQNYQERRYAVVIFGRPPSTRSASAPAG
ncbi:MAG TPA: hypothetical protein VLM89_08250 [Phycisphaerae bacterium]|nr:hypothetical protein [Phycisphaerae bacterium]